MILIYFICDSLWFRLLRKISYALIQQKRSPSVSSFILFQSDFNFNCSHQNFMYGSSFKLCNVTRDEHFVELLKNPFVSFTIRFFQYCVKNILKSLTQIFLFLLFQLKTQAVDVGIEFSGSQRRDKLKFCFSILNERAYLAHKRFLPLQFLQ